MDMDSKPETDPNQPTIHKFFTKRPGDQNADKPSASSNTSKQDTSTPSTMVAQKHHGHGQGSQSNAQSSYATRRAANAATATETRTVLPDILKHLPDVQASRSETFHLSTLVPLRWADCPRHAPQAKIRVVDADSLNAAVELGRLHGGDHRGGRVAVLNMASHSNPGGGWLKGATAQEEALCYRSSLSLSLHKRYYPFKQLQGIYTPDVVIIRGDMASGHKLLVPEVKAEDLPVVSVLSVAAIRGPEVGEVDHVDARGNPGKRLVFAKGSDRLLTKEKMRLCLRMAASMKHSLLVLGALGCGAFRNPPHEVVQCWREVFEEAEFGGGWWRHVWFAVLDRKSEGNFEAFSEGLDGLEV
jgi:hypothetical protein